MAVFAGLIAGLIAGLLMAPQTGSSLRKDLARNAKQAKGRITEAFRTYRQQQSLPETE